MANSKPFIQQEPLSRKLSVTDGKREAELSKGTLIAGVFAGITASACCLGPLLLLALGISGSWISNLTALEPYRPIFIAITLFFLGLAFRKLYLVPKNCAVDTLCAKPANLRKQRFIFWVVSIVVVLIVTFPWYGVFFLE